MISRRRFLAISAAALASPAAASQPVRWQGRAMGADVSLTIDAPERQALPALADMRRILARGERLFSLYDPASTLSRLNRTGRLDAAPADFLRLLALCDRMHRLTGGLFNPTVQPLWAALAQGGDVRAAGQLVGWDRLTISGDTITLDPGQALTLNGVAQGFVTDMVATALRRAGLGRVLVNIGEFHGGGRDWTLGISDPAQGLVATRRLRDRALATSSPGAMLLPGGQSHILDPTGDQATPWSTVSVEAADAATADALSTAFCHAPAHRIATVLAAAPGRPVAVCVAADGGLRTIAAPA